MAANNLKPKQVEDAALAGELTTGIQPRQNFIGVLAEAHFREYFSRITPTFFIPGNPFLGVAGAGEPDVVSNTPTPEGVQTLWRHVIGPSTGGREVTELTMNQPGRFTNLICVFEVTTAKNYLQIQRRATKVSTWAIASRALSGPGITVAPALVLDRGNFYNENPLTGGLTPEQRQEIITTVTSAGGYILLVRDLEPNTLRSLVITEQSLRLLNGR